MRWVAIATVLLAAVAVPPGARADGERPTEADLAACAEFARLQPGRPAYSERAPLSPFPSRVSGVSLWTGPITATRAPIRPERPVAVAPDTLAVAGVFGAGGDSHEATLEAGAPDPAFREAFQACMRARGF